MLITLDEYRRENGWSYSQLARALDEDPRKVRRWCLAPSHPEFCVPRAAARQKVKALTGGRVTADSWDAPAQAEAA